MWPEMSNGDEIISQLSPVECKTARERHPSPREKRSTLSATAAAGSFGIANLDELRQTLANSGQVESCGPILG